MEAWSCSMILSDGSSKQASSLYSTMWKSHLGSCRQVGVMILH
uniref:Uncharacterized protein n=1 Tax=Physcomitrium patens TaxID=3218 RepID=A0A7I4B494_PHYPA